MSFFAAALKTGFKTVFKKILILIAVLTMTVLLSVVIVVMQKNILENSPTAPITVAVVNHDTSPLTKSLIGMALNTKEFKGRFNIVFEDSIIAAKALLRNGEAVAVAVLPENFLADILVGTNSTPQLIISGTQRLEAMVLATLSQSLANTLGIAQSGIYTAIDGFKLAMGEYPTQSFITDINLQYADFALNRSRIFENTEITPTGTLTTIQHYTIYIFVFFVFLSCCIFFKSFNCTKNAPILNHLKSAGASPIVYYFAQLTPIFIVYTAVFFAFSLYLAIIYAGSFLVCLIASVIGSALLCCVTTIFFNISENLHHALPTSFLFYTLCLFVSGGIIPPAVLPSIISFLKYFSPIHFISQLFGCVVLSEIDAFTLIGSIIFLALTAAATVFITGKKIKKAVQ